MKREGRFGPLFLIVILFSHTRQCCLRLYKILRCPNSPQNNFRSLFTHIKHIKIHNTQLRFNDFGKRKIIKRNDSHIFRDAYSRNFQFIYAAKSNILICANYRIRLHWQRQQCACSCRTALTGRWAFPQIPCWNLFVQGRKCAAQAVCRNSIFFGTTDKCNSVISIAPQMCNCDLSRH